MNTSDIDRIERRIRRIRRMIKVLSTSEKYIFETAAIIISAHQIITFLYLWLVKNTVAYILVSCVLVISALIYYFGADTLKLVIIRLRKQRAGLLEHKNILK